jgi:penicillin amidase
MRYLRVLIPVLLTVVVIFLLDRPMGSLPALGRLLGPVNGAMAAAEATDENWNRQHRLPGLQKPVQVWLEDNLVAHVRAANDHDLYFAQGYVHASFRLWQMDLQTRAAGGRVSEVVGPKAIDFDRGMRREGMVWGAQHSLEAMERDPQTKVMLDAYRDGINAYVRNLDYRHLPIEYKLMGFYPEEWTNLRTALLMKYMARDLTGKTDDIAFTLLRDNIGQEQFDFLFPERIKGSKSVVPEGTSFSTRSLKEPQTPGDTVFSHFTPDESMAQCKAKSSDWALGDEAEDAAIGSNNWAVSGVHTVSGKPILCNDPHLGLNLPSLWFEMQLSAPGINAYGASLPGAPGIVIGFNEKISWGFTNNYRDVKDFYRITPATGASAARVPGYLFAGRVVPFDRSIEVIKVKGLPDVVDTVYYTLHGPVTYDARFPGPDSTGALLACTWMGHRGSNELLATYLLNRAQDYNAFTQAIAHFECPAQNIAYADGAGNIAIWGQGTFINKWKGQGRFVMEGNDSLTLWGQTIPVAENPHVLNPPQGYVASANQQVTDSTYPYWYNGSFVEWRSWEINNILSQVTGATGYKVAPIRPIQKGQERLFNLPNPVIYMDEMQNNTGSELMKQVQAIALNNPGGGYATDCFPRDLSLHALSTEASRFQVLWAALYDQVWGRFFKPEGPKRPSAERTVTLMVQDSASRYFDDPGTPRVETLRDILIMAQQRAQDSLNRLKAAVGLEWYKVKNTSLTHLAKLPAFSYDYLKIGGWANTINACTDKHGPSWRMIVEMDEVPKAYTIYPGGQSGNPGSRHYGDYIEKWVTGKYHEARLLMARDTKNPFPYTWTLNP